MILKKTIEFEVYSKDIDGKFTWNEAVEFCRKLKDGWRLPTREELYIMWENKDVIGGFADNLYWSSLEFNANFAWFQYFGYGDQNLDLKINYYRVRPVRDVKQNEK